MNTLLGFFKRLVPTRVLQPELNICAHQALTDRQETSLDTYIEQVLQKVWSELALELQQEDDLLTEVIANILHNIQNELCFERNKSKEQHCGANDLVIEEYIGDTVNVVQEQSHQDNTCRDLIIPNQQNAESRKDTVLLEYIWGVLRVVQKQLLQEEAVVLDCSSSENIESSEKDFLVHLSWENHLTAQEEALETCTQFDPVCTETAVVREVENLSVHSTFENDLIPTEEDFCTSEIETCATFGSVSSETGTFCEEKLDFTVDSTFENSLIPIEEDLCTEVEAFATFGSVFTETGNLCEEESDFTVDSTFENSLIPTEEDLCSEPFATFGSVFTETGNLCEEESNFLIHSTFENYLISTEEDLCLEIGKSATFGSVSTETGTLCEEESVLSHYWPFVNQYNAREEDLFTEAGTCSVFGSVSTETAILCEPESVIHAPVGNFTEFSQPEVCERRDFATSAESFSVVYPSIKTIVESVLEGIVNNLDTKELTSEHLFSTYRGSVSDCSMSRTGTSCLRTAWTMKGPLSDSNLPPVQGLAIQDTQSCPLSVASPQTPTLKDGNPMNYTDYRKAKPNHGKTERNRAKMKTNKVDGPAKRTTVSNKNTPKEISLHSEHRERRIRWKSARKRRSPCINSEKTGYMSEALPKVVRAQDGRTEEYECPEIGERDGAGIAVFGKPVKKFKKAIKKHSNSAKDRKGASENSSFGILGRRNRTQRENKKVDDNSHKKGLTPNRIKCGENKTEESGRIEVKTTMTGSETAKKSEDPSTKADAKQKTGEDTGLVQHSIINNESESLNQIIQSDISNGISNRPETYDLHNAGNTKATKLKKRPLGKIPSLKKPKIIVRPTKGSHAARDLVPPADSNCKKPNGPPKMAFGHKLPPIKDDGGLVVQGKKVKENAKPSCGKTKQRKFKTPQKPIWERYKKPMTKIGECHSDTTASSTEVKKVTRVRRNKTISDPVTLSSGNSGEQGASTNECETTNSKEILVSEEYECVCDHSKPGFEENLMDLTEECDDHVETPVGNTVLHDVKRVEKIRRQLDMVEENTAESSETEAGSGNGQEIASLDSSDQTGHTDAHNKHAECILIDLGEPAEEFQVQVQRQTQSEPCYYTFDLLSDFTDPMVQSSESEDTLISEDLLLDLDDNSNKKSEPAYITQDIHTLVVTEASGDQNPEDGDPETTSQIRDEQQMPPDKLSVYQKCKYDTSSKSSKEIETKSFDTRTKVQKEPCEILKIAPLDNPGKSPVYPGKEITKACLSSIENAGLKAEGNKNISIEIAGEYQVSPLVITPENLPKMCSSFPETKRDLNKLMLMNLTEFDQKSRAQDDVQESAKTVHTKSNNPTVFEESSKADNNCEPDGGEANFYSRKNTQACNSTKSLPAHLRMTTVQRNIDADYASLSVKGSSLPANPSAAVQITENSSNPEDRRPSKAKHANKVECNGTEDKSDQLFPGTDKLLVIQGRKNIGMPSSNKSFRLRTESLKKLAEDKAREQAKSGTVSRKPKCSARHKTRVISENCVGIVKGDQATSGENESPIGPDATEKLVTISTEIQLTNNTSQPSVTLHPISNNFGSQLSPEKTQAENGHLKSHEDETAATKLHVDQLVIAQPETKITASEEGAKRPSSENCSNAKLDHQGRYDVTTTEDAGQLINEDKHHRSHERTTKGSRRHRNKETCQKILRSYLEKREEFRALRSEDRHKRIIRWLCDTNSHLPQSSPYRSAQVYFFNVELDAPLDNKGRDVVKAEDHCGKTFSCLNNNRCLQVGEFHVVRAKHRLCHKPLLLSLFEAHKAELLKCFSSVAMGDLFMNDLTFLRPVLHCKPFLLIWLNLQNKDHVQLYGEITLEDFVKPRQLCQETSTVQFKKPRIENADTTSETFPAKPDASAFDTGAVSVVNTENLMITLKWLIAKFQETSSFMLQQCLQERQRASLVNHEEEKAFVSDKQDLIFDEQVGWYGMIRSFYDTEPDSGSTREVSSADVGECQGYNRIMQGPSIAIEPVDADWDPGNSTVCKDTTGQSEGQHHPGSVVNHVARQNGYSTAESLEQHCQSTQCNFDDVGETTLAGELSAITGPMKSKRRGQALLKKMLPCQKTVVKTRDSSVKKCEGKKSSKENGDIGCLGRKKISGRNRNVSGLFDCLSVRASRGAGV